VCLYIITGNCANETELGTLTQEDVNTWLLEAELFSGNYYVNFRDSSLSSSAQFAITSIEVVVDGLPHNGSYTTPTCVPHDTFNWEGMVNLSGAYEYLFSAAQTFTIRITVSALP